MQRTLFNLAAAVSLLICLASLLAWARSWLPSQVHAYSLDGRLTIIAIESSDLEYTSDVVDRGPRQAWDYLSRRSGPTHDYGVAGLRLITGTYKLRETDRMAPLVLFAVPFWFLAIASGVLPVLWLIGQRRVARRQSQGKCRNCGYDCRATPERCPECGTAREVARHAAHEAAI